MRAIILAALVIVLLPAASGFADQRCGEGRYWAHGHHDRYGGWHPGHCRYYR
jgi:hypothetical protein